MPFSFLSEDFTRTVSRQIRSKYINKTGHKYGLGLFLEAVEDYHQVKNKHSDVDFLPNTI